jgi:hypothetical protein
MDRFLRAIQSNCSIVKSTGPKPGALAVVVVVVSRCHLELSMARSVLMARLVGPIWETSPLAASSWLDPRCESKRVSPRMRASYRERGDIM